VSTSSFTECIIVSCSSGYRGKSEVVLPSSLNTLPGSGER